MTTFNYEVVYTNPSNKAAIYKEAKDSYIVVFMLGKQEFIGYFASFDTAYNIYLTKCREAKK